MGVAINVATGRAKVAPIVMAAQDFSGSHQCSIATPLAATRNVIPINAFSTNDKIVYMMMQVFPALNQL